MGGHIFIFLTFLHITMQNLPLPFKLVLGGPSETFPWSLTSKTFNGEVGVRIRYLYLQVEAQPSPVHARLLPFFRWP